MLPCSKTLQSPARSVFERDGRFRAITDEASTEKLQSGALGVTDVVASCGFGTVGVAPGYRLTIS